MEPGQYFGEIELRHGGANIATIRAAPHIGVDVVALGREAFVKLVGESAATRADIDRVVDARLAEHAAAEHSRSQQRGAQS
jgi:CRP-like cAMP-binding protein